MDRGVHRVDVAAVGALFREQSVVFAKSTMITTVATTAVWLIATLLTQPESDERLVKFYRRVQPTIHGWKRIAATRAGYRAGSRLLAANAF